jgi:NAD-dependent deacetylase
MTTSFGPHHEITNQPADTELVMQLQPVANLLLSSRRMVVFTGAGISTESGIPDYRGPDGVWQTNRIPTAESVPTDAAGREERWQQHRERYPKLQARVPNAGHLAIADLERQQRVQAIITQNIDGLHQKAGSAPERVLELHGSSHRLRCVDCGWIHDSAGIVDRLESGERDPRCERCGGVLRTSTVLFGEPLPEATLRKAVAACTETDLMLVVGSSLVVKPAAQLPIVARKGGASLVIINREPTPLDALANSVVRGEAGPILQTLAYLVLNPTDPPCGAEGPTPAE